MPGRRKTAGENALNSRAAQTHSRDMQGQNPDELFDVVDEEDRVIGVKPRREVHRLGLRHRAIHVLIFNRHGELFLQKRSMLKDAHPGLLSTSCAGHLDSGEDYDQAAPREMAEELGISPETIPTLTPLFKLPPSKATGMEFVRVDRAELDGPFQLNPAEVESGLWMTPDRLDAELATHPAGYTPSLALIWKKFRA